MNGGHEDKYSQNFMTNKYNEFNLSNTNFMPTLNIEFLNYNVEDNYAYLKKHDIDILEDDHETISLTKLKDYISIELRIMYKPSGKEIASPFR